MQSPYEQAVSSDAVPADTNAMSRRSALLAPPDDPHGAARTAAALMFSGGLYSLALMFVVPGWSGDHVLQGLFLAGIWLVAGSAFLHADRLVPAWGWSVAAHLAPPAVAFTNIATDDATAGSRTPDIARGGCGEPKTLVAAAARRA